MPTASEHLLRLWSGSASNSALADAIADLVSDRYTERAPLRQMLEKLAHLLDVQEALHDAHRHGGRWEVDGLGARVNEARFADDPQQWAPALQGRRYFNGNITTDQLSELPPDITVTQDWPDVRELVEGMAHLAAAEYPEDTELRFNLERFHDLLVAERRNRECEARGGRPPESTVYDVYQRLARHPDSPTLRDEAITKLVELYRDEYVSQSDKATLFTHAPRALTGLPLVKLRPGEKPSIRPASAARHFDKAETARVYRSRGGYRADPMRHAISEAIETSDQAPARVRDANRPLRVLDAGAGTGQITEALKALDIPVEIVALDMSDSMLRHLRAANPDVPVVRASIDRLPFREESFDVVAFGTSLHWGDPSRTPAEVLRVLKPNGALISLYNLHKLDTSYHRLIHGELTSVLDENRMTADVVRGGALQLGEGFTVHPPREFDNPIVTDADGFRDMLRSIAGLARAPEDVQTRAWVGAEMWLAEPQNAERVIVPGRTVVQVAKKANSPASPRRAAKPGRS